MAIVVKDRVKVSTTTTGTGTITLGSAEPGFQTFSVVGNGNQTYYAITSGNNFEVGIGTYTDSGTTLSRDTVLESSNSGAKITLAGTSTVFTTYPAERAAFLEDANQIDMVVGSGSDAISIGNVVTRESNGETKKVKKTATTTNYSVSAADYVSSTISGTLAGSPAPHYYGTQSAMCGSDDGRFVFVWARGWSSYDLRIKTFIHTGSGNWTIGNDFNPSISQAASAKPTLRCRFVKNCNAAAGGTFFVFFHSTETNSYNQPWKYFMLTVTSAGVCTKYTTAGGTYSGMYDVGRIAAGTSGSQVYDGDTTIIDTSTDNLVKFLSAGMYGNTRYIGEWSVQWTGSQYNGEYIGGTTSTNNSYRANATSGQSRFTRIAYDHTNNKALIMCVNYNRKFTLIKASPNSGNANWTFDYASDGYGSELTNSGTVDQGYEYRQYITADGHGQVFFSIANYTAGQNIRWQVVAYDLTESSYSTDAWDRFIYDSYGSGQNKGALPIHYDHLNKKLFVIGFSDNYQGPYENPNNNLRVYTFSGITDTLESNLSTSSYDGNSGSRYSKYGFWGMVDTVSLSSLTDAKAGRWLQIAQSSASGFTSSSVKIKSGTLPHSITTNTTNKALSFGFAQQSGSAGNTISVLPFDSEGIEQNQTSLTHGTKYYVSSTGALVTVTTPDTDIANDTDNPLAGEAIQTTNLRLPTKSISSGGGGDPRVFCGAVDFLRDSGVGSSVIISKPDSLTASEIRAYEIHFYGVGISNDTSYNVRFKPYKNGSSVMTGADFIGQVTGNYNGSSYQTANQAFSFYLSFRMYGANYPYRNNSPVQNYNGNAYSGKFTGKVVYENNFKNAAYSYVANVRTGANNYYMNNEMGSFSAGSGGATTTDYAEQFYFYPGSGSFEEGIITVYAIKK
tara:strand:+ start:11427 stop:14126 length:2700 start_codon:yes stop_codon:yes gene_type:complete